MKQEGKGRLFLETLVNTSACFQKNPSFELFLFTFSYWVHYILEFLVLAATQKSRIANSHIKNERERKAHNDLEQKQKQAKTKIQEAAKSLNLTHSILLKTGRLVGYLLQ